MVNAEEFLERVSYVERKKEVVYEDVNAIEYFPDGKFARVYIKGKPVKVEGVLIVRWLPPIHPKTSEEKLPVTSFHSDTLYTVIHFDPYVKVRYSYLDMELTIIWGTVS
jgi:hypothetical protein